MQEYLAHTANEAETSMESRRENERPGWEARHTSSASRQLQELSAGSSRVQKVARLQQLADQRKTASSPASPDAPVQRIIKKTSRGKAVYDHTRNLPHRTLVKIAVMGGEMSASESMLDELQEMHRNPAKTYSPMQAVRQAKRNIRHAGREITGRAGPRIASSADLMTQLGTLGADTSQVAPYVAKHGPVLDGAFGNLEYTLPDLTAHLPAAGSAAAVHEAVRRTVIDTPAKLVRTASREEEFSSAVATAAGPSGDHGFASAIKGNAFEEWAGQNVPGMNRTRLSFSDPSLKKTRTSDGYDAGTKEIWDYKDVAGKVDQDQVEDYEKIVKNKLPASNGTKINGVNYLFTSQAVALLNKPALSAAGHKAWYVTRGAPVGKAQV